MSLRHPVHSSDLQSVDSCAVWLAKCHGTHLECWDQNNKPTNRFQRSTTNFFTFMLTALRDMEMFRYIRDARVHCSCDWRWRRWDWIWRHQLWPHVPYVREGRSLRSRGLGFSLYDCNTKQHIRTHWDTLQHTSTLWTHSDSQSVYFES